MRSNTFPRPATAAAPEAVHPPVHHRSKVVCIYCYRTLGTTASAETRARLLHTHDCIEARLAKKPAAALPNS